MTDRTLHIKGDELSTLWDRLDGLRKGTMAVKVEPDVLKRLLLDYGLLVNVLHGQITGPIIDPEKPCKSMENSSSSTASP